MTSRLETTTSVILAVCAVVAAGTLVFRVTTQPASTAALESTPTRVDNWESLLERGHWVGSPRAPVKLVVFVDFQCPFCRVFHFEAEKVMDEFRGQVAILYRHCPLQMHRHARAAALAADCAAVQQRFSEMALSLFVSQDSLGLWPWRNFAGEAGVPDLRAFEECVTSGSPDVRYTGDIAFAESLAVRGTPTVIVNGWRLARAPRADSLRALARRVIAGDSPY